MVATLRASYIPQLADAANVAQLSYATIQGNAPADWGSPLLQEYVTLDAYLSSLTLGDNDIAQALYAESQATIPSISAPHANWYRYWAWVHVVDKYNSISAAAAGSDKP